MAKGKLCIGEGNNSHDQGGAAAKQSAEKVNKAAILPTAGRERAAIPRVPSAIIRSSVSAH